MIQDVLLDADSRMASAISSLQDDLNGIRTGQASPALVENMSVDYYGTPTPLMQIASIAAPEPQMITIRPYDEGSLTDIERAIQSSSLGLNPSTDGKLIRLILPPLTEERRRELTKVVSKRIEKAKVAIRNVRRSALEDLREFEKEKMVSEDDFHRGKDELQKLTDSYIEEIESIGKRKEKEILAV